MIKETCSYLGLREAGCGNLQMRNFFFEFSNILGLYVSKL